MKIRRRHLILVFILIICLLIVLFIGYNWPKFSRVLRLVLFGTAFAYILTPFMEWLERYMSRNLALLTVVLVLILTSAVSVFLLIPMFVKEFAVLIDRIPYLIRLIRGFMEQAQHTMDGLGIPRGIREGFVHYVENLEEGMGRIFESFMERTIGGFSQLPELLLVPV